jgi:hypothetical protein
MLVIIDGYKQPERVFEDMKGNIKDEIEYTRHDGIEPKRVIITPFLLWDYTKKYGDKKTDVVISAGDGYGYIFNEKEKRFKVKGGL